MPIVGSARARKGKQRQTAVDRIASAIGLSKLGREIARRLVRRGVTTLSALRKPSVIASLPKAAQANAMYGTGKTRAPLREAEAAADEIKRRLEFCVRGDDKPCVQFPTYTVGSVRRRVPTVKDLDILVVVPARSKIPMKAILPSLRLRPVKNPHVTIMNVYATGVRRSGLVVKFVSEQSTHYFHTDIFLATSTEKPFALFHYTGDTIYNVRTRALAKKSGMLLNQYGLFDVKTGERVAGKFRTEKDVADRIGVSFRTPMERNSPAWMRRDRK
jgi:DNA polymerase/3'-5' exonuclease PolX